MAVTMKLKQKPQDIPLQVANDTAPDEVAALIDEVGALMEKIEALVPNPLLKELADKKKLLVTMMSNGVAVTEKITKGGEQYVAELGACGWTRTITDMDKVKKLIGPATFMEIATVTLANIDKYLDEAEKVTCIKKEQDGSRSFKLLKKV